VLREKGMKLYRIEGNLQALTYALQLGVKSLGTGEHVVAPDGVVQYSPVKKINVQWKVGPMVWREGQEGVIVEETLPCILEM
jgi:hypothetical protein